MMVVFAGTFSYTSPPIGLSLENLVQGIINLFFGSNNNSSTNNTSNTSNNNGGLKDVGASKPK